MDGLIDQKDRSRCEAACKKLEAAIADLDACSLEIAATHAFHCLEQVQQALLEMGEKRPG